MRNRPWYKKLSVQFLLSVAGFILLIEAVLMVLSYWGMETRLYVIRERMLEAVPEPDYVEGILDEEERGALLRTYMRNISIMVVVIMAVAAGGVALIFQRWVNRPINQIQKANQTSASEGIPRIIPAQDIPDNEIGDIMRSRNRMLQSLQELFNEEAIESLVQAVDAKDSYTHSHSRRVASLSMDLARELDLSRQDQVLIQRAGLLHDIGKIGIEESILQKQGPLTDKEHEAIQTHPNRGADMIQISNLDDSILQGIRHHHERFDGSGYPDGLEGDSIPLFGRILGVTDAIDAMISDRHYRRALSLDETRDELEQFAGEQFDPNIAEAALTLMDDGWLEPYHEHRKTVMV